MQGVGESIWAGPGLKASSSALISRKKTRPLNPCAAFAYRRMQTRVTATLPLPIDFLRMLAATDVKTRMPCAKSQDAGGLVQNTRPVCFVCRNQHHGVAEMASGSVAARPKISCCWRATPFSREAKRAPGVPLFAAFYGFFLFCCQNATTGDGRMQIKYLRELYFPGSRWFNCTLASVLLHTCKCRCG